METESIVFTANTPAGIGWDRFVLIKSSQIGSIKAGSAYLNDPKHYTCPPWLTVKTASKVYKLDSGKTKQFTDRKKAHEFLWKHFKPKTQKASEEDFSSQPVSCSVPEKTVKVKTTKPSGEKMIEKTKRTRTVLAMDAKIATTGKQPKSEKNTKRLAAYKRSKVSTILEKHPEISAADIKYDIKCGYAEIIA